MANQFYDFPGASGRAYRYFDTPSIAAADLMAAEGNYMFVKKLPNGNAVPVYIGQCDNFKTRLPTHEQIGPATRLGAMHVLTRLNSAGEQARLDEERDLIQRWQPTLNDQHRKVL